MFHVCPLFTYEAGHLDKMTRQKPSNEFYVMSLMQRMSFISYIMKVFVNLTSKETLLAITKLVEVLKYSVSDLKGSMHLTSL